MNTNIHWLLTKRLTNVWIATVIVVILCAIGATRIHQRARTEQIERIRADIRQIDSATAQIALR